MNALLSALESLGILVGGLLVRFGLLVLVLLVLTVVFLVGLAIVRATGLVRQRALGLARVDGMLWKRGLYYAPGHTWIEPRSSTAVRVGLDDLAQRILAGLTSLKLPEVGTRLHLGAPVTEAACGSKQAWIASPVEGTVTAVNDAVAKNPSLVHRDPYARGWLFQAEIPSAAYATLPTGEPARRWFNKEADRFSHFMDRELGLAAADGGALPAAGPTLLKREQWEALTRAFLTHGAGDQPAV